MKTIYACMLSCVAALLTVCGSLIPASAYAQEADSVTKTYCTSAAGYADVDTMKADLLANAKRLVVNELFGELIAASTEVKDMVVTGDQIRASSLGFVRTSGDADFYNGENFAEICVTIEGYVTAEDLALFEPVSLTNRHCVTDADKTTAQLTAFAREEVIVQALYDYDRTLASMNRDAVLQLMQRVEYSESGFVRDTETYCVQVEGSVVPIEIAAFVESSGATVQVADTGRSTSGDLHNDEAPGLDGSNYTDTFDEQENWSSGVETSDPSTEFYFEDGELIVRVEAEDWTDMSMNEAILGSNFHVEVDTQPLTEGYFGGWGIVLRRNGEDFYLFEVNFHTGSGSSAQYSFYLCSDGECESLQNDSFHVDSQDRNRLGVIADGRKFTLIFDGIEVGEIRDTTISTGSIGLAVSNYGSNAIEVAFDNFQYTQLP